MKELPPPDVYKDEYKYMPWGDLITKVLETICVQAPMQGKVLDLLCGPGILLNMLSKERSDLQLTGVDIDPRYIEYAHKNSSLRLFCEDVLSFETEDSFDVIVCTAGIHHLPYDKQEEFIRKASSLVKKGGFCVFADPYIDDYTCEKERRLAAAKLGYEYLVEVIRNNGTKEVLEAAIDVLYNDVLMYEYKTSVRKLKKTLGKYFAMVEVTKTWPKHESEYGDYYLVCQ